MLFTAAAQVLLLLLFAGVGLLAPWSRFREQPTFLHLLLDFWSGWALVIAALQIWHLLFPVGAAAFWLVVLASAAGWFLARRSVMASLRALHLPSALLAAALASVPALALASHVFFAPPHFDHGLYHEQTVMWLNRYAVVPGLGNLHHRLAFNNSNFLYAALLNAAPFAERAYFTASTTLAFALILLCAAGLAKLFEPPAAGEQRAPLPPSALYYALMLPAALWHFSTTHLPGYSPDTVVFALQAVLGGELLRLFERRGAAARGQFTFIALLAAAGVTVKLSFGVFGALALLAGLAYLFWNIRAEPSPSAGGTLWKSLRLPAALAALLVVPWLARGVLLSGYPLFPSAALGLALPWRMPPELVDPVSGIIRDWARTANNTIPYTADLNWLKQWYAAFPFDEAKRATLLGLALGAAGGLWLIVRLVRRRTPSRAALAPAVLMLISALSLAGWFVLAPAYRFSGALVWMLLAAALGLLAALLVESSTARNPLLAAAALVLGLAVLISPNHFEIHKPGQQLLYPVTESEWVRQFVPEAARGAAPEQRATTSGLLITLPAADSEQCFDLPLPCTRPQDFLPALRLIDPDDMRRGFTLLP